MSNISDHKLTRMKKEDIIKLFRETEEKLFGFTASAEKAVVEIEELNERIDDHMIQEAMNKKTINELNESNKKLMEKVKFYQNQKDNNKKRDNKIFDYFEKGMLEKIEGLEAHNKELQLEVIRLEELCKQKHNNIELLEKEKEELIEECKEKNKWNEKLQEHHDRSNERICVYMSSLLNIENELNNLRVNDEKILKSYAKPKTIDSNINQWITDCCEECENIKDGIIEVAPTELDNLYCDFKEWAQKEEIDSPTRNIFRENLKIWQKNSRFGLQIGEKKRDAGINGYEAKPRFNLKVI